MNESVWEHLKLVSTPMLIFSAVEYFAFGKTVPNFVPVKMLAIFVGMLSVVVIFYTYTKILGHGFLAADIGLFVVSVLIAYSFSYNFLQDNIFWSANSMMAGIVALLFLVSTTAIFSYYPPRWEIFRDSVSGKYGA